MKQIPLASILCLALAWPLPSTALAASPTDEGAKTEPAAAEGAPDPTEESEAHRQAAITAFEDGNFEGALDEFEAAHALDPDPAYIFNIGRVYEEMGDLKTALERYEEFVAAPRVSLDDREAAQERADRLRNLLDEGQEDEEEEPVAAKVDDDEKDDGISAKTDGTKDDPPAKYKPLVISGSVLLGTGVAVAIGGGVGFGIAGSRLGDDVNQVKDGNPDELTLAEVEDLDAQGRSTVLYQIITVAAGGALAVVGAGLLGTGLRRRAKAKSGVAVLPTGHVHAHGGGVGLVGRF